jgi:hypothetical protein
VVLPARSSVTLTTTLALVAVEVASSVTDVPSK